MRKFIIAVLFLLPGAHLAAGSLLINEVVPGAAGSDWGELYFHGECHERMDVSRLFVTMYYGSNEPISGDPVTLYGCDRPGTPWDDRFAVVYLTAPGVPDETDLTGDTNQNGVLDVYCNNYSSSLWNSDCVVAIDTDDEPSNGGIIDFLAFSNRDESPNSTMLSYLAHAQSFGHWESYAGENPQFCMVDIGLQGLPSHRSIARVSPGDTNRKEDFVITSFQTPGRPNLHQGEGGNNGNLFRVIDRRVTVIPGHPVHGRCDFRLFVRELCSLRLRLFTPTGMMIHESPLIRDMPPGNAVINWDLRGRGVNAGTGLYLAVIEGVSSALRRSHRETITVIVSRYR